MENISRRGVVRASHAANGSSYVGECCLLTPGDELRKIGVLAISVRLVYVGT
jgi:hypothetical protein